MMSRFVIIEIEICVITRRTPDNEVYLSTAYLAPITSGILIHPLYKIFQPLVIKIFVSNKKIFGVMERQQSRVKSLSDQTSTLKKQKYKILFNY